MTVRDRGTNWYNLLSPEGEDVKISEEEANVMSYKKIISASDVYPLVIKSLKTKYAEPEVNGGIITSTLEIPDPGSNGKKEDKEKYAFIMWWKDKNGKTGTSLDETAKQMNGKMRYQKNEINEYVLRNPIYFLRKGFDDEYEKFLKLKDDSKEKKEVMDFYQKNHKKKSSAKRPVPERLDVFTSFNKKPTFHDIEREAAKAASNRMEQLMSKPAPPPKTPSSSAPPPPPPSNITARGASSRDTAGWNKIDNKNIGVRITTSGKVMIARKGATNMEEAQVQHVYNVPSGFVDKLKTKENSFEWYGATWKLNKDTKLYEKQ
tara:strand:- start:911 stop:1867 length:957 start_codon:yes stop_codon:yes gene_type:complete